jgi:peptide-methionine (S)-S-oxide reductase
VIALVVRTAFATLILVLATVLHAGASTIPSAAVDQPAATSKRETAVLAGGCFWGVEAVFDHLKGVRSVVSGYAGGDKKTARSELVEAGGTGHAESVKITYNPAQITYGQLLKVFFSVAHDPTQLNRQGPDEGTQYQSIIFYADDTQKNIAEAYIRQLDDAHVFPAKIVTEVRPLQGFYEAEEYHQRYCERNPDNHYVVSHDLPMLKALKQQFPELYR